MYLPDHARRTPDKPALIIPDGQVVTYAELDARSNRLARLFHDRGLRRGDHIAVFMENHVHYVDVIWAAFRSGLYLTPINRYLNAEEAAYILGHCGATAMVTSHARADVAAALGRQVSPFKVKLMVDGCIEGWESLEAAIEHYPASPLEEEWIGDAMSYSSGTTGRPKGIIRPLLKLSAAKGFEQRQRVNRFGFSNETVYLSPAPVYHSAPLAAVLNVQSFGGTVVMMQKFDAEEALRLIDRHRVTHSQWVPTMFVRMLKLPTEVRSAFDLASHRLAIHAAAPCPVDVKHQMIDWWGPILYEYYAGTEGAGTTAITSEEWLSHPGSVGRASLGVIHICDDEGLELPTRESGLVYFERDAAPFTYHDDEAATLASRHPLHANWTAAGDVGYLDEEGYLYLTDRKAFMIISGGVNIYPQAIEDALIMHPKVSDVAVFGVPDPEMGESVKAVVEPRAGVAPSEALAAELIEFARERMAAYMAPRSIDFIGEMPRLPTGKLYKRVLRDRYWSQQATS